MNRPYFIIESENKIQKIFLADILFIALEEDMTIFQLITQKKYCDKSLKEIGEVMPKYFFRISRHYIVNTIFIKEFIKKDKLLILTDGTKLIVSQRNVPPLIRLMRNLSVNNGT